jgi:hypothetical protein
MIMNNQTNPEPECCPPFDPQPWDEVTHEWKDKPFIRDRVRTFFYMPLNFAKVISRMNVLVEKSSAAMPDYLCLSDHTSKWNMDLYLAVDKPVAGAENVTLSGKFFSKVYEGSFNETGKWMKDFDAVLNKKGLNALKTYMWYTTCPKCAKKYNKNYVVLVASLV